MTPYSSAGAGLGCCGPVPSGKELQGRDSSQRHLQAPPGLRASVWSPKGYVTQTEGLL